MLKITTALLFVCATALAQFVPPTPVIPFPEELRRFLDLTNAQVDTIRQVNNDFQRFVLEKQVRMIQVQREIQEETAKETLDPMALGLRFVEVEEIRREIRDRLARTRENAVAALTDQQRAKLKTLEDVLRLLPVVSQAQCENLLVLPNTGGQPFPGNVIPGNRFSPNVGCISFATPILAPAP